MLLTGDVRLSNADEPFALVENFVRDEDVVYANLESARGMGIDPYENYANPGWVHSGTAFAGALR